MFTHNYFMPVCFVPEKDGPQPAEVITKLMKGYRAVQAARSAAPAKTKGQ
jgi:hypothetical protein